MDAKKISEYMKIMSWLNVKPTAHAAKRYQTLNLKVKL